jgi:peroxiredoxin
VEVVSLNTPICNFGWQAKEFNLLGVDGKQWNLSKVKGKKGLIVMFICNHCPYVKAILPRLVNDLAELKKIGINAVGISSNDVVNYPEDSYENMQKISQEQAFSFPYLFDESQEIAKAYDAICTPDFFWLQCCT